MDTEPQTFLVFIRNMHTLEDFSVPAQAFNATEAQQSVMPRYPGPSYALLTAFNLSQLQEMINDAPRWPGVASTVQPPLEQLLQRVTASTKLPPLHRNQTPAQTASNSRPQQAEAPTGARIQSLSDVVPGAMANQAKAAQYQAQQQAVQGRYAHVPQATGYEYKPAARKPQAPATPVQGRSVIDVLKALRG